MNLQLTKIYLFFLILCNLLSNTLACEVTPPKKLILAKEVESYELKSAFKYKNCSEEEIKKFNQLLTDYSGTLNQRVLNSEISTPKITLTESFIITSLSSLINAKVSISPEWKIIDLKLVGQSYGFLSLAADEHLQVECSHCNNTGTKNIKLSIVNPISNTREIHWMTGNIAIPVEALVSTKNLSITNQALSINDFELKKVYSDRPEKFFTFKDKLPYHKANRPIRSGQVIQFNDISPLNLVQVGTPVQVKLNSNGLKLQSIGIPSRSGRLGEIIQLKNPKTNKIIIGKITNFNEVEVEL